MNKHPRDPFATPVHTPDTSLSVADMSKLRRLLDMVEIDSSSARVAFQIGKSRLTLNENGTIRLDGRAVVQTATDSITLDGALIELN